MLTSKCNRDVEIDGFFMYASRLKSQGKWEAKAEKHTKWQATQYYFPSMSQLIMVKLGMPSTFASRTRDCSLTRGEVCTKH